MPRAVGTDDSGAAAVEFAIVVVIILTFIFGIFEFSRAIWIQQALNGASREAVRYGLGNEDGSGTPQYLDCAGIRQRAKDRAPDLNLSDADIDVDFLHSDNSTSTCESAPSVRDGDQILIKITTTLDLVLPLVPLDAIEMSASVNRSIYTGIRP